MPFLLETDPCGGNKPLVIKELVDGYIQSPNYPNNYTNSLDCQWVLKNTGKSKMKIIFLEVKLQEGWVFDKIIAYGIYVLC